MRIPLHHLKLKSGARAPYTQDQERSRRSFFESLMTTITFSIDAWVIHSYTTGAILGALFMLYAIYTPSLLTESCAWLIWTINQNSKILSRWSKPIPAARSITSTNEVFFRERREHRLFKALLNIVPNLEARIMNGSSEEIKMIADLVSTNSYHILLWSNFSRNSCKRVLQVPDPMIRRVWKVW